jgi:hypothetical protein
MHVLQETVGRLAQCLGLDWRRRQQTYIRMDAGFGTDANLNWLLAQGYQVVAKGHSGRRAGTWGKRVTHWHPIDPGRRWIALPPDQHHFCRPTRTIAVRWLDRHQKVKHALYVVTDLSRPLEEMVQIYDLRAGLEVDIREDKQGLLLTHRRKRRFYAQEMLVLLNDLAHNFLVNMRTQLFCHTPLSAFGVYRLIQDVLSIPGQVTLDEFGFVTDLRLLKSHPYASVLADVLPSLWR